VAWIRSFDFILSYLHDPDGTVVNNLYQAGARTVLYGSPLVQDRHAMDQMVQPLESLAIYAAGSAARLRLPDSAQDELRQRVTAGFGHQPYAVFHPGSGSPRKNAPLSLFQELGARLQQERDLHPVYLTGEADAEVAGPLAASVPAALHVRDRPLREVAALLSGAAYFVGNDSGITHLAAALGVPTLALFGPSDPALWGPRGDHVRIVHAPEGRLDHLSADQVWMRAGMSG
jgi:ADP-heptose:LPS heptosyltransferase